MDILNILLWVSVAIIVFCYLNWIYRGVAELWPNYLPPITTRIRIAKSLFLYKPLREKASKKPAYSSHEGPEEFKKDMIQMHVQTMLREEGVRVTLKYIQKERDRLLAKSDVVGSRCYQMILVMSKSSTVRKAIEHQQNSKS